MLLCLDSGNLSQFAGLLSWLGTSDYFESIYLKTWITVVKWTSQALFTKATIRMKAADRKLTFITRYKTLPSFGASTLEYHLDWLMHIPSSQITLLYPSPEILSKSTLCNFMVCCWSVLAIVWHVLFVSAFLEICLSACRDAYWQWSCHQQHSIKTDFRCAVVFQFLLFSISRKNALSCYYYKKDLHFWKISIKTQAKLLF